MGLRNNLQAASKIMNHFWKISEWESFQAASVGNKDIKVAFRGDKGTV